MLLTNVLKLDVFNSFSIDLGQANLREKYKTFILL